ncbi:MAG: hypothetical protein ACFFDF_03870 [Candidatus Odinarchaeota archaeon]
MNKSWKDFDKELEKKQIEIDMFELWERFCIINEQLIDKLFYEKLLKCSWSEKLNPDDSFTFQLELKNRQKHAVYLHFEKKLSIKEISKEIGFNQKIIERFIDDYIFN